jgi:hypothetical protein
MVAPADLVGSTLGSVTASWEVIDGERAAVPNHVWLDLSDAGLVQIVTDGQSLGIVHEEPYVGYSMGDRGQVEVETDARTVPVENFTEATVIAAQSLERGFVLTFATGSVAFANVNDEVAIGLWPDPGWEAVGVA